MMLEESVLEDGPGGVPPPIFGGCSSVLGVLYVSPPCICNSDGARAIYDGILTQ
jgi:hypothetical protein